MDNLRMMSSGVEIHTCIGVGIGIGIEGTKTIDICILVDL